MVELIIRVWKGGCGRKTSALSAAPESPQPLPFDFNLCEAGLDRLAHWRKLGPVIELSDVQERLHLAASACQPRARAI